MTEVSTRRNRSAAAPSKTSAGNQAVNPAVRAFNVVVNRVERISSNFRRITFGGACLSDFGVQGSTLDLRIKVMIPPANGECADLGALMDGEGSGWYQQWLSLEPSERGDMRTYTVRDSRCDQETPELDVDFVMHFDAAGNGGPASQWAAAAEPGDRVWLIGPNIRKSANLALDAVPEDIDVDKTILWETPQLLDAAALDGSLNPDKPSGALPFYAWIAGEAAVVRGLRRYLVRDVGIDRKQVAFMGYWRQGKAEG